MTMQRSALTIPTFSPAWKRVEEHYGAAFRFGRQAVEEAWHCGDALIAAKAETPHSDWMPALSAAGIASRTARRMMQLRLAYVEIGQLGQFDSVHAALQLPQAQQPLSQMSEILNLSSMFLTRLKHFCPVQSLKLAYIFACGSLLVTG